MNDSNAPPDQSTVIGDDSRVASGSADIADTMAESRRKIVDRLTGVMPRTTSQAQRAGSALNQLAVDAIDECRQRIRERPFNAVLMGVALGCVVAVGLRGRSF